MRMLHLWIICRQPWYKFFVVFGGLQLVQFSELL